MKFGSRSISLFLLTSQEALSGSYSSAFRPLSFGSRRRELSSVVARAGLQLNPQSLVASRSSSYMSSSSLMSRHLLALPLTTRGGAAPNLSTCSSTALNSAVAASAEEATAPPVEIFRKDYEPLPLLVANVEMDFQIKPGKTIVTSKLSLETNPNYKGESTELTLDGDERCVKLLSLQLNGKDLQEGTDYELAPGKLILKNPPPNSELTTVVEIVPEDNTQLSGLYKSGSMYCTQCEAMGFRRITYYPDRPDNMATFTKVRLEANQEDYPVLLANGNLVEEGGLENGRHYAIWSDPYPKPSYLFCCVAGKLGQIEDTYTTVPSGRKVKLQIFSEPHNVHKLDYAMESLKRSMKWDEDKFGLEYDLDIFNIVAVDDFNMGAMENKGLNVFNTAYVLADQETATDGDFERVEGVIGHEVCMRWSARQQRVELTSLAILSSVAILHSSLHLPPVSSILFCSNLPFFFVTVFPQLDGKSSHLSGLVPADFERRADGLSGSRVQRGYEFQSGEPD
jgi:hypothetical protein